MLKKYLIPLAAAAPLALFATPPTDNPVLTAFPTSGATVVNDHTFGDYSWSDELKWATVTTTAADGSDLPPNHPDATALDIAGSPADDLATVQAEIDTIALAGGGVLYFPSGDYFFSDDLVLKEGVIIRGADPVSQTDAREMDYDPPTNFWFPKAPHIIADANVPETGRILDTDNAAFSDKEELLSVNKVIKTDEPLFDDNIGVVNIDIQRARINFLQRDDSTDGTPGNEFDDFAHYFGTNAKNRLENSNIVVFGNRINNATAFDPRVPFHPGEGAGMNTWQRWMNRAHAKIDVMAHENAIIANNRIGDYHYNNKFADTANKANWPIDDFGMPARGTGLTNAQRYLQKGGGTIDSTVFPGVSDTNFGYIIYRYNQGLGILLNRSSRVGYGRMNTPVTEPSIYNRNMIARQNWIHIRDRVGIQTSGNGVEIRDNERRDYGGRQVWMNPQGTEIQTNNSATYENRGIDFGGVNVLVDNNIVDVRRASIRGGYPTIDGEAILVQDNDAGYMNNVSITNNTIIEGPIFIYRMKYNNNFTISGNTFIYIEIAGASNAHAGATYGLVCENNEGDQIRFYSELLPYETVFRNNTVNALFLTDYSASLPNSNIYTLEGNSVAPTYEGLGRRKEISFPAENFLDLPPEVKILSPKVGDTFVPGTQVEVRVEVTMDEFGLTPLAKVNFYDGTEVGPNVKASDDPSDDSLNTKMDDLAALELTLEGADTGLGGGIYTGMWTVPAGIDYATLVAEARAEQVSVQSIGYADETAVARDWSARNFAFLEVEESSGNGEPAGYRAFIEGAANIPSGQDGMNADPDKDGLINLLEYAFGTLPGTANVLAAPVVEDIGGTDYISVTFDKAVNDVNYNPLYTDSLDNPFVDANGASGVIVTENANSIEISVPLTSVAGFSKVEVVVP